jgi:PilZ domain-containing protein
MKLRRYGRIAVELSASFSGASSRAQGLVLDLSLTGCRAHSTLAVKKDDCVGVLIEVPGDSDPLYITQATIRWVNAQEFGMEFLQMELTDRQRLQEIVQTHAGKMPI